MNCCQVYLHSVGSSACYPKLNAKGGILGETLDDFVHDFVAPEHPTFDGFQSQAGKNTKLFKNLRKYNIDHHVYAPQKPQRKRCRRRYQRNQASFISSDETNEGK